MPIATTLTSLKKRGSDRDTDKKQHSRKQSTEKRGSMVKKGKGGAGQQIRKTNGGGKLFETKKWKATRRLAG